MRQRTDAINRLHRMILRGNPARRDAAQVVDDLAGYVLARVRYLKDTTEIGSDPADFINQAREALTRLDHRWETVRDQYTMNEAYRRFVVDIRGLVDGA